MMLDLFCVGQAVLLNIWLPSFCCFSSVNAFQIWKVVTSRQSHIQGSRLVDFDFAIWRFRPDLFVFHPLSRVYSFRGGFWTMQSMFPIIGLGSMDGHSQRIKHYQCCHHRRSYPTPPHHHSHLTSCSAPRLTTAGRCCWWCCCAWPSFESSRRTPVVGATLRKCVIESLNTQHILVWSSNVFPSIFVRPRDPELCSPILRWKLETWRFEAWDATWGELMFLLEWEPWPKFYAAWRSNLFEPLQGRRNAWAFWIHVSMRNWPSLLFARAFILRASGEWRCNMLRVYPGSKIRWA